MVTLPSIFRMESIFYPKEKKNTIWIHGNGINSMEK